MESRRQYCMITRSRKIHEAEREVSCDYGEHSIRETKREYHVTTGSHSIRETERERVSCDCGEL